MNNGFVLNGVVGGVDQSRSRRHTPGGVGIRGPVQSPVEVENAVCEKSLGRRVYMGRVAADGDPEVMVIRDLTADEDTPAVYEHTAGAVTQRPKAAAQADATAEDVDVVCEPDGDPAALVAADRAIAHNGNRVRRLDGNPAQPVGVRFQSLRVGADETTFASQELLSGSRRLRWCRQNHTIRAESVDGQSAQRHTAHGTYLETVYEACLRTDDLDGPLQIQRGTRRHPSVDGKAAGGNRRQ